MDERQLQQLIINISALHQELQKQSAEALSLQAQGIRRLEEGLSEVNRLVADEVSNQMAAVSGDLRRNIKKGSQEGLDDLRAEIDDVKKHMEDFAGFYAVAQNRLDAASRSVLLKIGYLAVAALVCVIGVSLWQGWYYGQVVREKKASVENLELFSQADIVKCGERLCAKTAKNTPAEYRKQGYVLIEFK